METRIKQFKKIAVNSKIKKKSKRRRKATQSRNNKENIKNMINIRTQFKESSPWNGFTNISFAYESVDVFQPKETHNDSQENELKISTCKFPIQDQSGGDKSYSSLLKK